MTIFQGKIRIFAAVVVLLAVGAGACLYIAAALLERALATERTLGDVTLRAYGPEARPLLAVRADSLIIRAPGYRLLIVRPEARLVDWLGFSPSRAALRLRGDSLALSILSGAPKRAEPPAWPVALRFPLGTTLEWRVLAVTGGGVPPLRFGPARWQTRGSQAVEGTMRLVLPRGAEERASRFVRLEFETMWRGPALRYRLAAAGDGGLSVRVTGIREKRDLRAGFDSVEVRADRVEDWLPPSFAARLPALSAVRFAGKADWRTDSIRLGGRFHTASVPPFAAATWNIAARLGRYGGNFALGAAGGGQTFAARGSWSHPGTWFSHSHPDSWSGEASARLDAGSWRLAHGVVPLVFEVPLARLDTGLNVTARVLTPQDSRIDVRWSGRHPGRVLLEGTVASGEPWAFAWTGDHVAFESAQVKGVWEEARLRATARVREPRAYGAFADSLEAVNEVTASGYFLKAARIHHGGEVFTGDGKVLWRKRSSPNAGRGHDVALDFTAEHPEHGRAGIVMTFPGPLVLTADSLWPSRFPHEWSRRFQAYDPWLHGNFRWSLDAGRGEASVRARFTGRGDRLEVDANTAWTHDSLRIRALKLALGGARFEADGVLPFDGRRLVMPWGVRDFMSGSWRFTAESLNPAGILALLGRPRAYDGLIDGGLAYAPSAGLSGTLRLENMPFQGGLAHLAANEVSLRGVGDSLYLDARLASLRRTGREDTVTAVFTGLNSQAPSFRLAARTSPGLSLALEGRIPQWRRLVGTARATGSTVVPFPGFQGELGAVDLRGMFETPLNRNFFSGFAFTQSRFTARYVTVNDTIALQGTPVVADGILRLTDLEALPARGGRIAAAVEASLAPWRVQASFAGTDFVFALPGGESVKAREADGTIDWRPETGFEASLAARDGHVALPPRAYFAETGFETARARVRVPASESAPTLTAFARLHDFSFRRKWGWRDATAFFTGYNRGAARPSGAGKRGRPWELDLAVEAAGTRNRIETDVLRMNFTGDARLVGVPPYALVSGKMSGLQGEVGQVRQAFALRDFEVRWDNVPLADGSLIVEGEKKLRADCRADTRQSCQIYVRLDGRLKEVGFAYDTDCGQNTGESVPPSVLINSMAQGCYAAESPGGEGGYGSAAFAMLEPALNERLSREFARGSGGFIKSTQVSGLSALVGSDSSGLESVALEVESRSLHRVSLKGRAGYHPETKLANPMEYRLAAEYRPPLDRWISDSAWSARLRNRFTVETAVETRPEGRDIEEERRVRQRAGLRYRHRFWNLW